MGWTRLPRIVDEASGEPAPEATQGSRRERWLVLSLWSALAVALVALVSGYETHAENGVPVANGFDGVGFTREMADNVYGYLALATGCGLLLRLGLVSYRGSLKPWFQKLERVVLCVLLVLSAGNWLYGYAGLARTKYVHFYDAYHYLLGPKYYTELGYFDLYECTVLADAETTRFIGNSEIRDLRGYRHIKANRVRANSRCKSNFSPERWEAFKADYEAIAKAAGPHTIRRAIRDYGYNGTPFNAWVGAHIADSFQLNYTSLTLATLIDTLSICALMAGIALTFGFNLGSLLAIAFFTAFSDRFAYIGASFFRYHWMVLSGFGLIAMARRRYATSSVLLSLAAMLNVFPVLFMLGIGAKACSDVVRTQIVRRAHVRFTLASLATASTAFLISVLQPGGLANWREFFGDMSKHSQLITVSRIGYKYLLLYRGEASLEGFSNAARTAELHTLAPFLYGLMALALGCILYLLPRLSDLEATIVAGFGTFFFALGTVEYYFGIYAFWFLLFHRYRRELAAQAIMAGSFVLSAGVYWAWHELKFLALCNNTLMSAAILVVVSSTFVYFTRRVQPMSPRGGRFIWGSVFLLWAVPWAIMLVRWPR